MLLLSPVSQPEPALHYHQLQSSSVSMALKEVTSDPLKVKPTSPSQTLSHLSLLLGFSLWPP